MPTKAVICPYCGDAQRVADRCRACSGVFEPLSRQATHNAMGPWFVRDPERPFQPGCSYETLLRLLERGRITKYTIIRGPTTKQFWTVAKHVPGLSHLLGYCPHCDASVDPADHACHACGAHFGAFMDRNYLGLPEIRPLPWQTDLQRSMPTTRSQPGMWRSAGDDDQPRTISSFVSDEELLGDAQPGVGNGTGSADTPAGDVDELPATFSGGPAVEAAVDEQPDESESTPEQAVAAADAGGGDMQHVLEAQQRTIRLLTVLMIATAALALAFGLAWLSNNQRVPGEAVNNDEQVEQQRAGDVEAPEDDAADDELIVDPESQREPIDVQAAYAEAMDLLTAAADEQRSVRERADDYQQAATLLESIQSQPREQWPDDLEQQLAHARREHDRLRMQEYFP